MPFEFLIRHAHLENGKTNCVLVHKRESSVRTVVFIPGDISEFSSLQPEILIVDPNKQSYSFSLEHICTILASDIGDLSDIMVIKPTDMLNGHSIFTNFLLSDPFGTPRWNEMRQDRSLSHPGDTLLKTLSDIETIDESLRPRTLVGFSKGCAVIIGILEERNAPALARVQKIILIDPGTNMQGSTFPFTEIDYREFPSEINIAVYVTPYQFRDSNRPWLRDEILEFVTRTGATLHQILSDEPVSLDTHFKAITVALQMEKIP